MIVLTRDDGPPLPAAATHTTIATELGDMTVVARGEAIVGLYFPHHRHMPLPVNLGAQREVGYDCLRDQLDEYLGGKRRSFDVAVRTYGDELQERVWDLVRRIPYGQTATYGHLARELSDGTTPQEVGAAVGRNPVCILVPCHRVVGSNGKLTGYAGGLRRKRFLLDLEQAAVWPASRLF